MQQVDYMDITVRGRAQRQQFEVLAEKDMALTIYPDGRTMTSLGIKIVSCFYLTKLDGEISWYEEDLVLTVGWPFSSLVNLLSYPTMD